MRGVFVEDAGPLGPDGEHIYRVGIIHHPDQEELQMWEVPEWAVLTSP